MFLVDFHVNNLGIWSRRKQTYFFIVKKIVQKSFVVFKRALKKYNWFWEEKSVTVNIKRSKTTPRCYICGKNILKKLSKSINYRNIKHDCYYTRTYRGAAHDNYNLKLNVPNEIPVVFHNGSNYDYKNISKMSFRKIWMSCGKYRKVQNFFSFQLKKKL